MTYRFLVAVCLMWASGAQTEALSNESMQAYEKAQQMRQEAKADLGEPPSQEQLAKASRQLLEALDYVRSSDVVAMYEGNRYLKARQWDILRDLVHVSAMAKNRDMVMTSIRELKAVDEPLGWVLEEASLNALMADDPEYHALLAPERAWSRIMATDSMTTPYQQNISDAEKLAGLAMLWSEARNHFVYFDQVPELDWDLSYRQTIPKVLATTSTEDYYRVMMQFVALLKDGHSDVMPPQELRPSFYSRPPLYTVLIEDRVLIAQVYSQSVRDLGVAIGDEITHIDGEAVKAYAERVVRPYQSASTPQDLDVRTYHYALLRGDADQQVRLTLSKPDGSEMEVSLSRSGYEDISRPPANQFRILDSGVAYMQLDSFQSSDSYQAFVDALPQIQNAKGLILDVRDNGGGDTDEGLNILSHLTDQKLEGSLTRTRESHSVDRARGQRAVQWHSDGNISRDAAREPRYDGPVAVLIGPITISAAEDFAVVFELLDRGLMVGTATAGSTGQPLFMSLPGGGSARVCSKRDSYPNGRDWVGVGVQPDITISRSVSDFRQGRDPVIEAASDALLAIDPSQ